TGAGMARIKRVVHALLPLAEPAESAELPQGVEPLPPSRQQLVGVGLVARIPDNLILRRVQQRVQGHRQLDDAQVRGKMPSDVRDDRNDLLTDFLAQL